MQNTLEEILAEITVAHTKAMNALLLKEQQLKVDRAQIEMETAEIMKRATMAQLKAIEE